MIERLDKPSKHYKIGLEDFRNIAKRKQYLDAYDDMLEQTDTDCAPWHVIASDEKMHARLKGLKVVADVLGKGVKISSHALDPRIAKAAYEMWGWQPPKADEDWRNREKWDVYNQAVEDMLIKTSTRTAPWTIVEGNDKGFARVKILKTIVDTIEQKLEG